jgi:hypothetical protein
MEKQEKKNKTRLIRNIIVGCFFVAVLCIFASDITTKVKASYLKHKMKVDPKDTQSYRDTGEMVGASSPSPKTVSEEPAFDLTSREITPSQIIGDHWNLTRNHFLERDKHLRSQNMSINDLGTKIEQLQAEHDDEYLKVKSKLNELVQIQKLIDAGMISPEHGFRAKWRIALSDKMYEAMFP